MTEEELTELEKIAGGQAHNHMSDLVDEVRRLRERLQSAEEALREAVNVGPGENISNGYKKVPVNFSYSKARAHFEKWEKK